jgi:hypothetical protein
MSEVTAYELQAVLTHAERVATDRPLTPAAHVLRLAAARNLRFEAAEYLSPWSDPTFLPRYEWIRDETGLAESQRMSIRDFIPKLKTLIDRLTAAETHQP